MRTAPASSRAMPIRLITRSSPVSAPRMDSSSSKAASMRPSPAVAYAPYADLLWCETSSPDLEEAREFADAIHARYPGKLLAYNCSPSFTRRKKLDPAGLAEFQRELGQLGYRFQFVTLAGFHTLNLSMFQLASS